MISLPEYIGVSAFGIKMGVIGPGSDLLNMVYTSLEKCDRDGLLHDGDAVCITESVLARSQNNYVTINDIVTDVYQALQINSRSTLGIVFPLLSRNRFSLIIKALAKAVKDGEVIVQFSHPADEVGNQLLPREYAEERGLKECDIIHCEDIIGERFKHPITQIDYMGLYQEIILEQGARATIFLCNDPAKILNFNPQAVIVANVHNRFHVMKKIKQNGFDNVITLQELCNDERDAWSEWGLLGSNLSSNDKLKLAPREADQFACDVQGKVLQGLGKKVEVIIYGDGAYCDPSTGIYELADPQPAFGKTAGLQGHYREGFKYKYLVDKMLDQGSQLDAIAASLLDRKTALCERSSMDSQGTTPRKTEDLIASLADLISGSADAGTPLIIVKGFLNKRNM